MYIEEVKIRGYKKFTDFQIKFHKGSNVIIGENETGKSTVLEAIDIVLNQKGFLYNNAIAESMFSLENVALFKENPIYENLPEMEIELFFDDDQEIDANFFNGLHWKDHKKRCRNGITFSFSFDEDFKGEYEKFGFSNKDNNPFVPIDYYKATWKTCAGHGYTFRSSPIKNVLIDNSSKKDTVFNSYAKRIFQNHVDPEHRTRLSHYLKSSFSNFIKENEDLLKVDNYSIGIDEGKTYIEQLIDLKSQGVPIQNMGKGTENLIKTKIALKVKSDLILLEEPENHLSHVNTRRLISEIRSNYEDSQIILTTHSPLIVSRLNLQNTIWIRGKKSFSLGSISDTTASYFEKTDNMNVLQYILSKKVILVEGNAEYIVLPQLVVNTLQNTLDKCGIEVISGAGLTYKHYVELTKVIENNLLVLTDNDEKNEKISNIQKDNTEFETNKINIRVVCDTDVNNHTFEVCLFDKNSEVLNDIAEQKPGTKAEYRKKPYDKNLAYMLKNKTEAALVLLEDQKYKDKVILPDYIKEGIEWLIQS